MSNTQIQSAFVVNGQVFATKEEASDFIRKPLIKAALMVLTGNQGDLVDWLIANQTELQDSYVAGTITRVTKAERKELKKAVDTVVASGLTGIQFIIDNADQLVASFKWPTKARVKPEEKEAAVREAFLDLTDNNAELVDWLIANKDGLDAAFEAGKEKRAAPVGGQEALAAWRARRDAAKAQGPEALAAFEEETRKEREAKLAAKKAEKAAKKQQS